MKTFTDPRDSQAYRVVELNGLRWMAQNLNFDVGNGCWIYEGDPKNGEKYGRLYTWEAAKKACLPGWRLPTDEEWQALARLFGGCDYECNFDPKDGGRAAYEALIKEGSSGFCARLGGYRYLDGSFSLIKRVGKYWSATTSDSDEAWHYAFNRNFRKLLREYYSKELALSCRCVQEIK